MSEEEIKQALSIEVVECGNMGTTWKEINLLWNYEIISTSEIFDLESED